MPAKNNPLKEEIEIPDGIKATFESNELRMKKEDEEITRKINSKIDIKIEGNKIFISCKRSTRKEKKFFGSLKSNIKNAFYGLKNKFKYKLQAVSVHFPITVIHDKKSDEILIKNFLGEKKDRKVKIPPGVDTKINKDIIEVESSDIEKAGQVAANIEKATKIRFRDRRVFQDGVFIIEKPGRKLI